MGLRFALWFPVLACLVVWPSSQSAFLLPKAIAWHLALAGALAVGLSAACRNPSGLPSALASTVLPLGLFTGFLAVRFPWIGVSRSLLWEPFLWTGFLGTLLVAGLVAREPPLRRSLQVALLTAGSLAGAVAVLQYLGLDPLGLDRPGLRLTSDWVGAGRTPVSLLGNPSYLGEFLAGLVPFGVAGMFRASGAARAGIGLGLAAMGAGLLVASARGPALGAAAGVAFLALRLVRASRRSSSERPIRWWPVAGVGVAILLVAAWPGSGVRLWERFLAIRDLTSGSVGARLYWWRVTGALIGRHALIGIGPGRFRVAFAEVQGEALSAGRRPGDRRWTNTLDRDKVLNAPHNEVLHVLAEGGIFGLALLAWGIGAAIRVGLRAPPDEGRRPTIGEGAVAGMVGLGVAALFGFPLHTAAGLCVAGALAGLAVGGAASVPRAGRVGGTALLLGFTLVAVLGNAWLLGRAFAASRTAYRGVVAGLQGDHAGAAALFDAAHALDALEPDIRYLRAVARARIGRVAEAITDLEAALPSLPIPGGYQMLADLHQRRGDPQAAEAAFVRGLALFPGHTPLAVDYITFLARRERYAEALRLADGLLQVDPRSVDGHHLRAHILARAGREGEAAASLRRFLEIAPSGDARRAMDAAWLERLQAGRDRP